VPFDSSVAVFDPDQDRVLVFHPFSPTGHVGQLSLSGAPQWSIYTQRNTPTGYSIMFDPVRRRVLNFGGWSQAEGYSNDVWALKLARYPEWEKLQPAGPLPGGRWKPTLVYDPARDAQIMFGGVGPFEDPFAPPQAHSDVWRLSLATLEWSRLSPAGQGPPPSYGQPAVFDPVNDRMILFASASPGGSYALRFSPSLAWEGLAPVPGNTTGFSIVLDSTSGTAVMFGGRVPGSYEPTGDVWSFDLHTGQWSPFPYQAAPSPGYFFANLVYDPVRDRFLLFASSEYGGTPELWAFSMTAQKWTRVDIECGARPAFFPYPFYDSVRDRLIAYGDGSPSGSSTRDYQLWELMLEGTPTWHRLEVSGVAHPPPNSTLRFDPVRNRLIGFYGSLGVWELPLDGIAQWDSLHVTGSPPALVSVPSYLMDLASGYDPAGDRLIMSGGFFGTTIPTEIGSWALSLGPSPSWTTLVPVGWHPRETAYHAVYDPVRNRIVAHGSIDNGAGSDLLTVVLDPAAGWSYLSPEGRLFARGYGFPAEAYDPVRDQLFVFRSDGSEWTLFWGTPAYPGLTLSADTTWVPGDTLAVGATLSNPLIFGQEVVCSVVDSRRWPGLPSAQTVLVSAEGERQVVFRFAVPETAVAGVNPIRIAAAFKQTSIRLEQPQTLRSSSPPIELVLLDALADSGRVRLRWSGFPVASDAFVERRGPGSDWREIGRAAQTTGGIFTFEDSSVTPGAAYDYRLRYLLGRRVLYTAEAHVSVPLLPSLALRNLIWDADHVFLSWVGAHDVMSTMVQRQVSSHPWNDVAVISRGSSGAFEYEDRDVSPGADYAYRLYYFIYGFEQYTAETRVHVPLLTVHFSLLDAVAESRRVRLTWSVSPGGGDGVVERGDGGGSWEEKGLLHALGGVDTTYQFEDLTVMPATSYFYRLRYTVRGQTSLSAPFEVVTSAVPQLSLSMAGPNPSRDLSLRVVLPDDRTSLLRVFDIQGRIVYSRELSALGPGEHALTVRGDGIRAGVYVVRLVRADRQTSLRSVVVP